MHPPYTVYMSLRQRFLGDDTFSEVQLTQCFVNTIGSDVWGSGKSVSGNRMKHIQSACQMARIDLCDCVDLLHLLNPNNLLYLIDLKPSLQWFVASTLLLKPYFYFSPLFIFNASHVFSGSRFMEIEGATICSCRCIEKL